MARFRQVPGIKQEALASLLQNDWTQVNISRLEAKENIDDALSQIADALKIPVEVIRNFDEEAAIVNIQNNYEGANPNAHSVNGGNQNYNCTFNPLDKLMEVMEESKRLYEELLKAKEEQIRLLERITNK